MSEKKVPSDSPWNSPEVVARFAASPGNEILLGAIVNNVKGSPMQFFVDERGS